MIEKIEDEIKQNKDLIKIYIAYKLLKECDNKYNLTYINMCLEDIVLNDLGYYEDFESHKLKKLKERK